MTNRECARWTTLYTLVDYVKAQQPSDPYVQAAIHYAELAMDDGATHKELAAARVAYEGAINGRVLCCGAYSKCSQPHIACIHRVVGTGRCEYTVKGRQCCMASGYGPDKMYCRRHGGVGE